jgi:hypothetical protein
MFNGLGYTNNWLKTAWSYVFDLAETDPENNPARIVLSVCPRLTHMTHLTHST